MSDQENKLRVYFGPKDSSSVPLCDIAGVEGKVEVPLQMFVDVLDDAVTTDRVWVKDFCDEKVIISTDLYEVITAYQKLRRSA